MTAFLIVLLVLAVVIVVLLVVLLVLTVVLIVLAIVLGHDEAHLLSRKSACRKYSVPKGERLY